MEKEYYDALVQFGEIVPRGCCKKHSGPIRKLMQLLGYLRDDAYY